MELRHGVFPSWAGIGHYFSKALEMAVSNELIDSLLANYKKSEGLIGEHGVLKQLTKRLVEYGLEVGLDERYRLRPPSLTVSLAQLFNRFKHPVERIRKVSEQFRLIFRFCLKGLFQCDYT